MSRAAALLKIDTTAKAGPKSGALRVSRPGDSFEREADHSAGPAFSISRWVVDSQSRRQCGCGGRCDTCNDAETVQSHAEAAILQADAPTVVHDVLRSPGRSLEPTIRAFMESRFGYDFSRVRIHDDSAAAGSARAVHANAYTIGRHIVFDHGTYEPATSSGQTLLAHELTHVVQQDGAAPSHAHASPAREASDMHERQARQTAQHIHTGGGAPLSLGLGAISRPVLQREPAPPAAADDFSAIVARLENIIKLGGPVPDETRVIGAAIVDVPGYQGSTELRAISGLATDALGAGAAVPHAASPQARTLSATRTISGAGPRREFPFTHINDAEIKIFEEITKSLKKLPAGVKGMVHFLTMRVRKVGGKMVFEPIPACSGCTRATFEMGQFRGVQMVSHAVTHPPMATGNLSGPSEAPQGAPPVEGTPAVGEAAPGSPGSPVKPNAPGEATAATPAAEPANVQPVEVTGPAKVVPAEAPIGVEQPGKPPSGLGETAVIEPGAVLRTAGPVEVAPIKPTGIGAPRGFVTVEVMGSIASIALGFLLAHLIAKLQQSAVTDAFHRLEPEINRRLQGYRDELLDMQLGAGATSPTLVANVTVLSKFTEQLAMESFTGQGGANETFLAMELEGVVVGSAPIAAEKVEYGPWINVPNPYGSIQVRTKSVHSTFAVSLKPFPLEVLLAEIDARIARLESSANQDADQVLFNERQKLLELRRELLPAPMPEPPSARVLTPGAPAAAPAKKIAAGRPRYTRDELFERTRDAEANAEALREPSGGSDAERAASTKQLWDLIQSIEYYQKHGATNTEDEMGLREMKRRLLKEITDDSKARASGAF